MLDHFGSWEGRKIFFLFSFSFLPLVRGRMDLLHFRFSSLRIRLLLSFIEEIHLDIAVLIFFTGTAKLFLPGKCQFI